MSTVTLELVTSDHTWWDDNRPELRCEIKDNGKMSVVLCIGGRHSFYDVENNKDVDETLETLRTYRDMFSAMIDKIERDRSA